MIDVATPEALGAFLSAPSAHDAVLRGLDLRPYVPALLERDLSRAVLFGCELEPTQLADLVVRGALVFPRLDGLPYEPWRHSLYTPEELFGGFDPGDPCTYCDTLDARVYAHFRATGGADVVPMLEAFARRLHDHGVSEALEALLARHERVVAFMGGHGMSRADPLYLEVARMAARLGRDGFLVATGGGPGAMEAANLGARYAQLPSDALARAAAELAKAPTYKDREWLAAAARVRRALDPDAERLGRSDTLGVPTFFYGHEPPNAFATHHAKYFANCVREEGLVSLATHGIVYAPGSAGTVQEIFQDACQNHYGTVRGLVSPMVLFGVRYWTEQLPALPLLEKLAASGWRDRVLATDDPDAVVAFLAAHGPRSAHRASWSFCGAMCAEPPAVRAP